MALYGALVAVCVAMAWATLRAPHTVQRHSM
jgi:hypothetical protein